MESCSCTWFKLYFICIIYDKYTNNTVYDYNTITIQMGFRRKSKQLYLTKVRNGRTPKINSAGQEL